MSAHRRFLSRWPSPPDEVGKVVSVAFSPWIEGRKLYRLPGNPGAAGSYRAYWRASSYEDPAGLERSARKSGSFANLTAKRAEKIAVKADPPSVTTGPASVRLASATLISGWIPAKRRSSAARATYARKVDNGFDKLHCLKLWCAAPTIDR